MIHVLLVTDTKANRRASSPMMIISRTTPMIPMMIIIFMLAHHCFRFNFPACCSNCDAPCCKASARWSNSDSFWSRSKTFSTFTRMMPTTSSTFCCVCWSRLLLCGWLPELCGGGGNLGKLWLRFLRKFWFNVKVRVVVNVNGNCKHGTEHKERETTKKIIMQIKSLKRGERREGKCLRQVSERRLALAIIW